MVQSKNHFKQIQVDWVPGNRYFRCFLLVNMIHGSSPKIDPKKEMKRVFSNPESIFITVKGTKSN